ncbi:Tumor suppressor candidate 3 [Taenia crassiceps]|uniref:Tumor suppressor candidate 3 n=1 Tax=Taenia crassiceps TaxID=6207 RepID=A0ABR4QQW0_9CEST
MHIILFRVFVLSLTFGLITPTSKLLDNKVFALKTAPRDHDLIVVDSEFFEKCIHSSPRNYSFTCHRCSIKRRKAVEQVAPKFIRSLFWLCGLQAQLRTSSTFKTAPFVLHFGPRVSINDCDKTNHPEIVATPTLLAAWITKVSDVDVEVVVSMDFSVLFPIACVLLFCALLRKFAWLRNTKIIATLCLAFICSMCSGLMWVIIHSMPFLTVRDGKVVYLYPENRAQFGGECLLIVMFYAMTSGGLVFLTNKCPKFRNSGFTYTIRVLIGLGVTVLGFNQMAEYYTMKAGYLPFHISLL